MENKEPQPEQVAPQPQVGFPDQQTSKGKSKFSKWIFAIIGALIVAGVAAFFVFKVNSADNSSVEGVSSEDPSQDLGTFPTPAPQETQSPAPTATPEPVDKSEISVEILNGTGKAGEASFLKSELEDIGIENIEAANADEQNETRTTVTFSRDLSKVHTDEITQLLKDLYEDVSTRKGTLTGGIDIRIITGPRKASAASKNTPSPSTSPTASPAPTESPEPDES